MQYLCRSYVHTYRYQYHSFYAVKRGIGYKNTLLTAIQPPDHPHPPLTGLLPVHTFVSYQPVQSTMQ